MVFLWLYFLSLTGSCRYNRRFLDWILEGNVFSMGITSSVVTGIRMAVFVAAWLCMHAASAKTSSWVEYTSNHFVVYSDRKPAEARRILEDFERFREAALMLTGHSESATHGRAQVFLFNRSRDYRELQPDRAIAGYFLDTWQGPRMVVGADMGLADVGLVLFHEYVHYLMRTHNPLNYPLWYEEGFADLLAASSLESQGMLVGLVHQWRRKDVDRDGLMPVLELHTPQDTNNARYWSRYYATAWVLMHYLQLGHLNQQADHRAGLRAYLASIGRGEDVTQALQRYLGVTPEQLDAALKTYAEKKTWMGFRLEVKPYTGPLVEKRLSVNDVAYLLGDLAYRSGQQNVALEWLKKVDAKQNSVARAFSIRAVIEQHQNRNELARHVLGLALKHSPNDPYVLTNAAHVYWDGARNESGKSAEENMLRAAAHALHAIQMDADSLEAAYFLAKIYRYRDRIDDAIALLEGFYSRFSSDVRLNLELGSLHAAKRDSAGSVNYLQRVIAWDHADTRRQQARKILQMVAVSSEKLEAELDEVHAVPIQILAR